MALERKYSIKTDFNMLALLFIPIGVAINFVGGQLASLLKLPVYLDTIGTMLTAILAGPWVGAVTGLLSNVVTGIANPVNFWFIPVNIIVGLVVGFLSRKDMWRGWKLIISFIIMDLVSLIVSTPIVVYVYGGVTGGGTSLLTAILMATGQSIWRSVISVEIIWTTLDRVISYIVAMLIIKVIPVKTLVKFSLGELYIGKKKPLEEIADAVDDVEEEDDEE
ncbi:MAG: ECF transporter S component [Eubacteriales bacterium]|jgi:energy-coupling factor transport system substrate-specific component|nr:ECF transporter S component [Eubacteriales bacterium]